MPRNYLSLVGEDPSDPKYSPQQISSRMRSHVQTAINEYQSKAGISSTILDEVIIVNDSLSLYQIICDSPSENPCPVAQQNYGRLENRARQRFRQYEANSSNFGIVLIFGGGGIASTTDREIAMGDWSFARELFDYSALGCASNMGFCVIEDGQYVLRHELIHAYGVGWHAPRYTTYPLFSISSAGTATEYTFADHPGYPEKYLLCKSSLNIGQKNCESRFQNPHRPSIVFPPPNLITGRLTVPNCTEYNTNYKVYFTKTDKGIGWGERMLVSSSSLSSSGSFAIPISTQIYGWQSGYALYPATSFPIQNPDINSFFTQYQLFFNPSLRQFCNEEHNGTPCHPYSNLVLESSVSDICASFGSTPTSTPTPTPTTPPPNVTVTPTPTPPTPYSIQGSISCQSNPSNMAGKTMNLYKGSSIVAQSTVFYSGAGTVGAYGFNYATNFTDGYYAIRPALGSGSCGLWFCPNNGGTYECMHRRSSDGKLIAKRNSQNCNDATNPQVWCNGNFNLLNCWMEVNATSLSFTSDSCGGGPTATPTNTPTPPTSACVSSGITASLGIIEKAGGSSTLMPNPGYEAALLIDHYQSTGPAPHYMEVVVHKTNVDNQSRGTQRVFERFLNQNPLDPNNTNLIRFSDWDRNVNWATTDVIFHYSQPICGSNATTKTQRVTPEQIPITRIMGKPDTISDPCVISGYFRSEAADFQNYLNFINGQIPNQSGVPITMEIYTGGYPAPYGNGQLLTLPNGQTQVSANIYRDDLATRWGSSYANHGYSLDLRNSPVANGSYQVLYLKLINPPNTVGETTYYPLPFRCAP